MNTVQIGKIVSIRGLKGEIKILSYTNIDRLYENIKQIIINNKAYDIETVKYAKNCPVLKLTGIDTPEAAQLMVGQYVFVDNKLLPSLDEGDYYVKDIIGSIIYDENENLLGKLTNVFFTGANDVYELTTSSNKTVLIPAVNEFILKVDMAQKKIILHLIEGMLD